MTDKKSIVFNRLAERGVCCRTDVCGRDCTTFKIGGRLALFAEPQTERQLMLALSAAEEAAYPCYVIGKGSNLLIPDEGMDALLVRPSGAFCDFGIDPETGLLTAGSGASLASVAKASVKAGLMGLEWAAGIPGSIGGAVAMNAGAYGGEIKDIIKNVLLLKDGRLINHEVTEGDMAYRRSAFSYPDAVVLSAEFALSPDDGGAAERMREYNAKRRQKQPIELPTAGSAFKRPEGHFAAALIDEAGLKGFSVGGAAVSPKHAGFIVNNGGATYADVVNLIDIVEQTVFKKFGVELEPEIKIL